MAQPDAISTVDAEVRSAAARLSAAGIVGPGRDARLLVAAALGLAQTELILRPDRQLTDPERLRLDALIARRCRHEPVSRILGEREFYGRLFEVTLDTLDPRPDSETLIEAVLEIVGQEGGLSRPLRILDIGTGTGCLLATLLCELQAATGVGIDVSAGALEVARRNAAQLGLIPRAEFRLQPASAVCDTFDIVVSNPPYIPTGDIAELDEDVRAYDPVLALDGGADGLEIYRQIAARLSTVVPAGWAFLELGVNQAGAVEGLMREALVQHFNRLKIWRDLGGHQRCVALEIRR